MSIKLPSAYSIIHPVYFSSQNVFRICLRFVRTSKRSLSLHTHSPRSVPFRCWYWNQCQRIHTKWSITFCDHTPLLNYSNLIPSQWFLQTDLLIHTMPWEMPDLSFSGCWRVYVLGGHLLLGVCWLQASWEVLLGQVQQTIAGEPP